jgi:SAM-dependent methyltransferase
VDKQSQRRFIWAAACLSASPFLEGVSLGAGVKRIELDDLVEGARRVLGFPGLAAGIVTTGQVIWIVLALVVVFAAISLAWRWASRSWCLPCPALLAWSLENPLLQRLNGTRMILDRLSLKPGQRVLELGPGPGRLLIPAAKQVFPGGEAVGIDIQPAMIERLKRRADAAGASNLKAILGDASQPHVPEVSFDIVFLCAALGEIPDRTAALAQCYRALKPGGVLSITEMFGDPHYQSRSVVKRLAEERGFRFQSIKGGWWLFTAQFIKL